MSRHASILAGKFAGETSERHDAARRSNGNAPLFSPPIRSSSSTAQRALALKVEPHFDHYIHYIFIERDAKRWASRAPASPG
jgi:hypothetical protein